MQEEEELLAFAGTDEEPVLKKRYVPSFVMGVRGSVMFVLVGNTSKNRFFGSKKFPIEQESLATTYREHMYKAWKIQQDAKKLEAGKSKSQKKP